ncbi:MAG TPA: hypothetical protein VJ225_03290 [Nitrososphaeraceae archaeon]|nr:hypothetical protein [Nitrososphaeraceae archaeon]
MRGSSKIKYVKLNILHLKQGKRDQNTKLLREFFEKINGKIKGMKGCLVIDNLVDSQETIVITFWETKGDMDKYYRSDNRVLSDFVLKAKSNFEGVPERRDYIVTELDIYQYSNL